MIAGCAWLGQPLLAAAALPPAAGLVATAIAGTARLRRGQPATSVRVLLGGTLATQVLVWGVFIPRLEPHRAIPRQIARDVAQSTQCTAVVVARPMALPSLPFYVLQQGLRFEDALESGLPRRDSLAIDWERVRAHGVSELVRQVKAQRGPQLNEAEAAAVRRTRVAEILARQEPAALVLDEPLAAALGDRLEGLPLMKYRGLLSDRLGEERYLVSIPPTGH
jgi:hypothetical protein